jgi:hypothetical protein
MGCAPMKRPATRAGRFLIVVKCRLAALRVLPEQLVQHLLIRVAVLPL